MLSFSNTNVNLGYSTVARVVNVAISDAGSGYTNADIVTVANGQGISANVTISNTHANGAVQSIVVTPGQVGSYTVLPDVANNVPTGGSGSGLTIDLTTEDVDVVIAYTFESANSSNINIISVTSIPSTASESNVNYSSTIAQIVNELQDIEHDLSNTNIQAANTNHILNTLAQAALSIANTLTRIDSSLSNIDSYIKNLNERGSTVSKGIFTSSAGAFTNRQNRAFVMAELKKDEAALKELEQEINNPTRLPGDEL